MPVKIKIIVSFLVAIVVGGFAYANLDGSNDRIGYLGLGLAALMLVSIWLFPETGNVPSEDDS